MAEEIFKLIQERSEKMSNIIPFDYHGKEIRTVTLDGEPWFVAKDVCEVLDIENPSDAIKRLDADERARFNLGRQGGTNIVSESGLYSLTLGSKKPEAKPFKRWITHEVIPAIRKTGGYVSDSSKFVDSYFPQLREDQRSVLNLLLDESRRMGEKIKADSSKVLFADAVEASDTSILVGELAKLIRQNGVEIGQTRLFRWLRENGYLIKYGESYNLPTQRSMELGLIQIKERTVSNPNGSSMVTRTPKITGKGQAYFINKFLREELN